MNNDEFMAIIRRPEFMELSEMATTGDWYVRINRLGRLFSNSEPTQDGAVAWAGRMFAQWDEEDKLYEPACQWLGSLCEEFTIPVERGTVHIEGEAKACRVLTWKETFRSLFKHAQEKGIEEPHELRELAEEGSK